MFYSIAAPVGCVCLVISLLFCVACLCKMCRSSEVHHTKDPALVAAMTDEVETNGSNRII